MASFPAESDVLWSDSVCYYLTTLALIFLTSTATRRRYCSPISDIPGPILASITRLHHVFHIFRGKQSDWISSLHDQYGPCVRISPDEVSVSHPDAPRKLLLSMLDKVSSRLPRGEEDFADSNRDHSTTLAPYRITVSKTHSLCGMRGRR